MLLFAFNNLKGKVDWIFNIVFHGIKFNELNSVVYVSSKKNKTYLKGPCHTPTKTCLITDSTPSKQRSV